jgi:hypothetical protein
MITAIQSNLSRYSINEVFCLRIARHASGTLSIDLFRVPEDKMQQNIDFLEKIIEKGHDAGEVALAAAEVLPDAHIGNIQPYTYLANEGWQGNAVMPQLHLQNNRHLYCDMV